MPNIVAPTPQTKFTYDCLVCEGAGTLDVTRREQRFLIDCWKCRANGLSGGDYLRALADALGYPGHAGNLRDNPFGYLGEPVAQTATGLEPAKLPSSAALAGWQSRLFSDAAIDWLITERGLTADTIADYGLGWDVDRSCFTFPVRDAAGELVNLVRRPWPHSPVSRSGKPLKYIGQRGRDRYNGGTQLYPHPLPEGSWLLVEGLLDAILGRQENLPTVTGTAGVAFLEEWLPLVRGRRIAVCYDVGAEKIMHNRVAQLRAAGAEAWPVRLRLLLRKGEGKDLTDFWQAGGTKDELIDLIKSEEGRTT
jgi:hypothetical protein